MSQYLCPASARAKKNKLEQGNIRFYSEKETDWLTGLYNREAMAQRITAYIRKGLSAVAREYLVKKDVTKEEVQGQVDALEEAIKNLVSIDQSEPLMDGTYDIPRGSMMRGSWAACVSGKAIRC